MSDANRRRSSTRGGEAGGSRRVEDDTIRGGPAGDLDTSTGGIEGYGHAGVLWSRATARDIVAVIAEDAETGDLAPAEAVELIDRVWARAADP